MGNGIHNRLSTEVKNNPHLLKNRSQCKSGLEIDFVRINRERSPLNRRYSGDSLKQFDPSDDETKTTHSVTIDLGIVSYTYTKETTKSSEESDKSSGTSSSGSSSSSGGGGFWRR